MNARLRFELNRCKTERRAIRVIQYLAGGHLAKGYYLAWWRNSRRSLLIDHRGKAGRPIR